MLPLAGQAQYALFDNIAYFLDDLTYTARVVGCEDTEIIENVDIPETVTYDGHDFSVTCIASNAFKDCTKLTSINIPNSVTVIQIEAFWGCTGLTSITIPNRVKVIGDTAFSGCNNLTSIEVAEGNPIFDSRENCNAIIETAKNKLVYGCKNSTIPNSVTTIGHYAFGSCKGLTSITIPNSVTNIEYTAFTGCSSLSSIIIGDHVENIGKMAFAGCSSITSLIIPNSVTTIEEEAFRDCYKLSSVVIGNGVKNIEKWTFLNCTNLSSVTIGNSVENIGKGAFDNCKNLISIIIPNNVKTISREAFEKCSNLASIVIGNGVTNIGELVFYLCDNLANVYSYAEQVPDCHWSAFSNEKNTTLHVPAASVEAYRNAEQWKDFGNIVALTDEDPKPTGISTMEYAPMATNKAIYDLQGHQLAQPKKGLNIIRMSDGKTKKVIVK